MASELYCEVTGEPIMALHNDGTHSIAGDMIQHSRKAGTIRTASAPRTALS